MNRKKRQVVYVENYTKPCKHVVGLEGDGKWRYMGKEPQRDKELSSWLSLKVLKNMFGE